MRPLLFCFFPARPFIGETEQDRPGKRKLPNGPGICSILTSSGSLGSGVANSKVERCIGVAYDIYHDTFYFLLFSESCSGNGWAYITGSTNMEKGTKKCESVGRIGRWGRTKIRNFKDRNGYARSRRTQKRGVERRGGGKSGGEHLLFLKYICV